MVVSLVGLQLWQYSVTCNCLIAICAAVMYLHLSVCYLVPRFSTCREPLVASSSSPLLQAMWVVCNSSGAFVWLLVFFFSSARLTGDFAVWKGLWVRVRNVSCCVWSLRRIFLNHHGLVGGCPWLHCKPNKTQSKVFQWEQKFSSHFSTSVAVLRSFISPD